MTTFSHLLVSFKASLSLENISRRLVLTETACVHSSVVCVIKHLKLTFNGTLMELHEKGTKEKCYEKINPFSLIKQ